MVQGSSSGRMLLYETVSKSADNTLKSVAIHPYTQTTAHYILDHPKVNRCFQICPLGAICKVNERLSFFILENELFLHFFEQLKTRLLCLSMKAFP